jgi:hypothetical protein
MSKERGRAKMPSSSSGGLRNLGDETAFAVVNDFVLMKSTVADTARLEKRC